MTKTLTLRSFDIPSLTKFGIGFDNMFDDLMRVSAQQSSTNYPPYDIVRTGNETYEIRVAVAGFTQADIDVEFNNGTLIVKGKKDTKEDTDVEFIYNSTSGRRLHHGISSRSFLRTFSVADYVEVKDAVLADGILTIKLELLIPESQKPKKIAVSYQSTSAA